MYESWKFGELQIIEEENFYEEKMTTANEKLEYP